MSSFPSYLIPVTRVRRFCAGLINFTSVSFVALVARVISAGSFQPATKLSVSGRVWAMVLLTALWLLCVRNRKSVGALVCMLEIRARDGATPTARQMVTRSAPGFVLAALLFFPSEIFPAWMVYIWLLSLFILLFAVLLNGVVGVVSGASLLDRLSKTIVMQVNLLDHAKPRIFGIRIV